MSVQVPPQQCAGYPIICRHTGVLRPHNRSWSVHTSVLPWCLSCWWVLEPDVPSSTQHTAVRWAPRFLRGAGGCVRAILPYIMLLTFAFIQFCFFIHIFLLIRSSYMGPQPKGCRTCQNSCNINKANICTVHKKKTIKKIYIVKYNTYLVLG